MADQIQDILDEMRRGIFNAVAEDLLERASAIEVGVMPTVTGPEALREYAVMMTLMADVP